MKPQPTPKPQPLKTVVAVPSITGIEYAIYNTSTRTLQPVHGYNTCDDIAYVDGIMPKVFRLAAEECKYEHELIFRPLPDTIEEIPLNEYPECKLVIVNAKVMQIAAPEVAPKRVCKVIQHPAVLDRPQQHKTAKILPLFPDYPTINRTA